MNNKKTISKHTITYIKISIFASEEHNQLISSIKKLALPKGWFIEEKILADDEDLYSVILIKDKQNLPNIPDIEERTLRLERAYELLSVFNEDFIRKVKEIDPIIFLAIESEQELIPLDSKLIDICSKTGIEIYS